MFSMLKKVYHLFKEPLFYRALMQRVAAGVEHRKLLASLQCGHVIDIGANRGQFALVSRKYFPDAIIDSFEPLLEPANIFEKIFVEDKKTFLHRFAIGEREAQATIHVSKRDDSSSLLEISSNQTSLFPNTEEKETRMIQVVPLDKVLNKDKVVSPVLLKIDVQGYELTTLKGCESFFKKIDYIYVECSFVELYLGQALASDVIDYLQKNNFKLQGIYNLYNDRKGRAIQADFFYRTRL